MIVLLITCGELDGYRRGELKLYEYQADEARKNVAVITHVVTETRTTENAADAQLKNDLASLRTRYSLLNDRAGNQAARLSSAIGELQACRADDGKQTAMPDARRMLDDVESAVLAILETGDAEIAKYRALYQRDVSLARIR